MSQPINFYINKPHDSFSSTMVENCSKLLAIQLGFPAEFTLQDKRSSPFVTYYTFVQSFNGMEINGTQVKYAIDKNNKPVFFSGSVCDTRNWEINFNHISSNKISKQIANQYRIPENLLGEAVIFLSADYVPEVVQRYIYFNKKDGTQLTLYCNAFNAVIATEDHRVYFTMPDSTVTGKVFLPDPLTAANTTYGGAFIDNNDADNPSLSSVLYTVSFNALFEDDLFYLKNENIVLKDLGSPTVPVVTSISPNFNFSRSQSGFEDVNAFYHLTNFADYISSLGYSVLQDFYMEVDPHGASGADQSFFTGGIVPSIQYGEGGVDDAEDADVIIHEYAHALSNQASPGSNTGFERRAADEGYGDYLAASYSRQFSDYLWGNIFNWDGHNEFWNGRQVNTTKVYPTDVVNPDIYKTGEIWSSALMDLFNTLGAEITDKLVFEALYGSFVNMSLQDAALNILNAENTIYSGIYNSIVFETLDARGLVNAVVVNNEVNSDAIQILNTSGFANNYEPLHIVMPVVQSLTIQLYNVQGQLLFEKIVEGADKIFYRPNVFTPGIYLLKINGEISGTKIQMIKAN